MISLPGNPFLLTDSLISRNTGRNKEAPICTSHAAPDRGDVSIKIKFLTHSAPIWNSASRFSRRRSAALPKRGDLACHLPRVARSRAKYEWRSVETRELTACPVPLLARLNKDSDFGISDDERKSWPPIDEYSILAHTCVRSFVEIPRRRRQWHDEKLGLIEDRKCRKRRKKKCRCNVNSVESRRTDSIVQAVYFNFNSSFYW